MSHHDDHGRGDDSQEEFDRADDEAEFSRDSHPSDGFMNTFDAAPYRVQWTDEAHATEESVYAWLDGAFSEADNELMEQHIQGCADCSAAVAEARGYIAASMRIMNAADLSPRNTQRNVVSPETIVRRVAELDRRAIVSTSDAILKTTKRTAKRWYQRGGLQAAAALLIMVAGSYAIVRDGAFTAKADSLSVTTPQPVQSPATSSGNAALGKATSDNPPPRAKRDRDSSSSGVASAPERTPSAIGPKNVASLSDRVAAAKQSANALAKQKSAREDGASELKKERSRAEADAALAARAAGTQAETRIADASASKPTQSLPPVVVQGSIPAQEVVKSTFAVSTMSFMDTTKRNIVGTVVDRATSAPLAMASITIPGTSKTAVTNDSGKFVITEVPKTVQAIMVRRLGYEVATVKLDSISVANRAVNATLTPARMMLDQVVVTGVEGRDASRKLGFSTNVVLSACIAGVGEAPRNSALIISRFIAVAEAPNAYLTTVTGWPTPAAATRIMLTADALNTLRGSVDVGTDRLEVSLSPVGENWLGIVKETRSGNVRSSSIEFRTDKSRTGCP